MAVQIISASGTQFGMLVNADGSINVAEGDTDPLTGYNPSWKFIYSGNAIGSIYQFIGTGSYVQRIVWSGNVITAIGSWGAG